MAGLSVIAMEEQSILCFGDSNTWGFMPLTRKRYSRQDRWTGVLQRILGSTVSVIAEGLNGRCAVYPDPVIEVGPALVDLHTSLASHRPLDLAVLMLGTNDCKARFHLGSEDIAKGMRVLARKVLHSEAGPGSNPPKLILVAPPCLSLGPAMDSAIKESHMKLFAHGNKKSEELPRRYQELASDLGCGYWDANEAVTASQKDGVHWEPESHHQFAKTLAPIIKDHLAQKHY